jgi:hypothetical protein
MSSFILSIGLVLAIILLHTEYNNTHCGNWTTKVLDIYKDDNFLCARLKNTDAELVCKEEKIIKMKMVMGTSSTYEEEVRKCNYPYVSKCIKLNEIKNKCLDVKKGNFSLSQKKYSSIELQDYLEKKLLIFKSIKIYFYRILGLYRNKSFMETCESINFIDYDTICATCIQNSKYVFDTKKIYLESCIKYKNLDLIQNINGVLQEFDYITYYN